MYLLRLVHYNNWCLVGSQNVLLKSRHCACTWGAWLQLILFCYIVNFLQQLFQFVNYEDESEFLPSIPKPAELPTADNMTQIISFTTLWLEPNPVDVTTDPISPLQLKATMRSQEAIEKLLPARPFGVPATCKEINEVKLL